MDHAADTADGFAQRLLSWLRTPADLLVAGLWFTVCSLPVVTAPWAFLGLLAALDEHRRADESQMTAAFFRGVLRARSVAVQFTLCTLPAALLGLGLTWVLWGSGSTAAAVSLGVLAVVVVLGCSVVLAVAAAITAGDGSSVRSAMGVGLRAWLTDPRMPLLAAITGLTLVAATIQTLWVAAVLVAALPAWMVLRWFETSMMERGKQHGK